MAKIDLSTVENYSSMTPEEKVAFFEAYELPEVPKPDNTEADKLKAALSKANAEAASYKRELREKQTEQERLESERKEADQKKIISDIKSLGYDGYFNWENKPMSGAKPFYKNLEESESYCIFAIDKVELVDVYMKDEIEDNSDFKKARQEDEDLFKKEIKEYLDSGLTEEEIIEEYESDTENQYVTIPVLEAVDIVQDVADEF